MPEPAPALEIHPLTPGRAADFLAFFDHEKGPAFSDNPEFIHPEWRRRGVARALTDAALESFAMRGIAMVEAYPFKSDDSEDPGDHYHGPLSMLQKAGFDVFGDEESMTIVRRMLSPPASNAR